MKYFQKGEIVSYFWLIASLLKNEILGSWVLKDLPEEGIRSKEVFIKRILACKISDIDFSQDKRKYFEKDFNLIRMVLIAI